MRKNLVMIWTHSFHCNSWLDGDRESCHDRDHVICRDVRVIDHEIGFCRGILVIAIFLIGAQI